MENMNLLLLSVLKQAKKDYKKDIEEAWEIENEFFKLEFFQDICVFLGVDGETVKEMVRGRKL